LRELALQHRPDLGAAAWRVGALEKRARVACRRKLPWFSHVQVSYDDETGLPSDEAWSVQAAFEIPVFQHVLAADADVASAEVRRGQAELLDLRRMVVQDVECAYRQAKASAERREAVRRAAGEMIAEIDTALRRAAESGGLPAIDRNRLELERLELQQRVNELDHLYYEALLTLESAVGVPPSEWPAR
jgi:outer membrane protein TolC